MTGFRVFIDNCRAASSCRFSLSRSSQAFASSASISSNIGWLSRYVIVYVSWELHWHFSARINSSVRTLKIYYDRATIGTPANCVCSIPERFSKDNFKIMIVTITFHCSEISRQRSASSCHKYDVFLTDSSSALSLWTSFCVASS